MDTTLESSLLPTRILGVLQRAGGGRGECARGRMGSRYHTIPGNVFKVSLGDNYDLALITNFLPDFGPEECERMLSRIRRTLKPTGRAVALQWVWVRTGSHLLALRASRYRCSPSLPKVMSIRRRKSKRFSVTAGFTRCELVELGPSLRVVIGYQQ
jgi:hypothetical protein